MKNMQNRVGLVLATLLCLLMTLTNGQWGVVETSEARYAEISREMYRSGDWLHPKLLNIHHYHKPPVTYWLTATAFSMFGVNTFAARFFLVIAFGIQLILFFKLAELVFKNRQAAFYSALVYATIPLVLISVRGLTTDAYLNTFVLLSLYFLVKFRESKKIQYVYGAALAMGLGFLTKGPVIFIVPLLAAVGLGKSNTWPPLKLSQAGLALLIFIVIGFSWFLLLIAEDSRFADYFFFRHFIDRIAHAEVFARKEPWYYYLPVFPLVTLPWIIIFANGLLKRRTKPEDTGLMRRLLTWWLLIPFIIFSVSSSKLVLYILPLSIGFSLVTGYFLTSGVSNRVLMITISLCVLIYIGLLSTPIYLSGFEGTQLLFPLTTIALILSIGLWFLNMTSERKLLILSSLFAITLILYSSVFFKFNSAQVNTLTSVSNFIKQNQWRERNVIVYDELLPSVAFELDKDIISVYAGDRSLKRETQFEKDEQWRNYLLDVSDPKGFGHLKSLLSQKSVLIVKKDLPKDLEIIMSGDWHRKEFGKWVVYYN
jgi:4-amino-4-deoxy-L-arabinose transferase